MADGETREDPGSSNRVPGASDAPGTDAIEVRRGGDVDDRICEVPSGAKGADAARRHLFPDNARRRIPAMLYVGCAAICLAIWALTRSGEPVLVNDGFLIAAGGLGLFALYSYTSGWHLTLDERDALVVAVAQVGFPVGHASAQMAWRGLRSRPTWRVLIYSAEEHPEKRGLVLVDGVDGSVVEWFVEDNPEDWTDVSSGA